MILGAWVNGDAASRNSAALLVVAFRSLINPTLKEPTPRPAGASWT